MSDNAFDEISDLLEEIFKNPLSTTRSDTAWSWTVATGPHAGLVVTITGTGLGGSGDLPLTGDITGISIVEGDTTYANLTGLNVSPSVIAALFAEARDGEDWTGHGGVELHDLFIHDFAVTERSSGEWQFTIVEGPFAGYVVTIDGTGFTGDGDTPADGTITSVTLSIGDTVLGTTSNLSIPATTLVDVFNNDESQHRHGGHADDHFDGGIGDDDLDGGAGNDNLNGGFGNDVLLGAAGNDSLNGGAGHDDLAGGAGNDTLVGGDGEDNADYSGATGKLVIDLLHGKASGDGNDAISGVEDATGSNQDDQITGNSGANHLDGGKGNDKIDGGDGNDQLIGGAGGDKLAGGTGDDALTGGTGNDSLAGGNGNDVLNGGAGADSFVGGAGNDTFVFTATADAPVGKTHDVITDFQTGHDHIDLSGIDANIALDGDQSFTFLAAKNAAFTGHAGELHWTSSKGHIFVEGDVNGDGKTDFAIEVNGSSSLTAGDFIL